MKSEQRGKAMGRPSSRSSFLGHPNAGFLARTEKTFYFCFSSLAERLAAARSGQGRAAFWRGVSAPLTARTAAKPSAREEKSWSEDYDDVSTTAEVNHAG
jgi:hypothetical protein